MGKTQKGQSITVRTRQPIAGHGIVLVKSDGPDHLQTQEEDRQNGSVKQGPPFRWKG